jgi:hypothetical protein
VNDRTVLDVAIEFLSVGLLLAGAAPALIAGLILAPALLLSLGGWAGLVLTVLLVALLALRRALSRAMPVPAPATSSVR